jgi:hypothetical protein
VPVGKVPLLALHVCRSEPQRNVPRRLELAIREAHSAADSADRLANIMIKISLKRRIAAGEAIAEAREVVPRGGVARVAGQAGAGPPRVAVAVELGAESRPLVLTGLLPGAAHHS